MDTTGHPEECGARFTSKLESHRDLFKRHLWKLPRHYSDFDQTRAIILFFCLSGLDLIEQQEEQDGRPSLSDEDRLQIIDWIYSLQVRPADPSDACGGFRGSNWIGNQFCREGSAPFCSHDCTHLTTTHICILCLIILKDDMLRLDKKSILHFLKKCQMENGSFMTFPGGGESDMRFCYCSVGIAHLLNGWEWIDLESLLLFVLACQSHDGGFGQAPGLESHGGSTYCALSTLLLINEHDERAIGRCGSDIKQISDRVLPWCIARQTPEGGFQGRPQKDPDTCYSFWVGASLHLIQSLNKTDKIKHFEFLATTQNDLIGGFSKHPGDPTDILHSFFGVCALSLTNVKGVKEMDATMMISNKTMKYRESL